MPLDTPAVGGYAQSMSMGPTRLACAWLFCLTAGACTPDIPTAGTIENPGPALSDATSSDQNAADAASADANPEADAPSAEASDTLMDALDSYADAGDSYKFDATKPDLPGAPDAPVIDSVADFDLWPRADLGQRYDPDIWQELPALPDTDPPLDVGPDADALAEVDTAADAPAELDSAADAAAETSAEVDASPDVADADASGDSTADQLPDGGFDSKDAADQDTDPALDSTDAPDQDADPALDSKDAPDQDADSALDSKDAPDLDAGPAPDAMDASDGDIGPDLDATEVQQDSSQPDATADAAPSCTAKTCDDGEPCTIDACLPSGNCSHSTLPTGTACLEGTCYQGLCSRNSPESAGTSCKDLKLNGKGAQSGVWWLDPDGPFGVWLPYPVWCDMVAEGGGWTLLLKVGETGALGYDSPLWTSIGTLNPGSPRMDEQEGKFDSYWSVPHTELRVGMHVGNQVAWLVLPLEGTSLFHLIKDDKPVVTSLPTAQWLGLLPGTKIQTGCLAQGLNVDPGLGATAKYNFARVRIGLVGNAESDCQTADSRIGLGGAGGTCGQNPAMTCGNAAGCYNAALIANQPAFGYVLAR